MPLLKNKFVTHYGMCMQADNGLRRPEHLPKLDYSKYWHGQELPPGTTINEVGVATVPSGLYHFCGYISPLRIGMPAARLGASPMQ